MALDLSSCTWRYVDKKGRIQGPFESQQMRDWFNAGYLPAKLEVQPIESVAFASIREFYRGDTLDDAFVLAPRLPGGGVEAWRDGGGVEAQQQPPRTKGPRPTGPPEQKGQVEAVHLNALAAMKGGKGHGHPQQAPPQQGLVHAGQPPPQHPQHPHHQHLGGGAPGAGRQHLGVPVPLGGVHQQQHPPQHLVGAGVPPPQHLKGGAAMPSTLANDPQLQVAYLKGKAALLAGKKGVPPGFHPPGRHPGAPGAPGPG
ncbi:unnamed protein product, partial [Amoebophrya sp. A25]|eukprot:GSA25T00017811001.1